MRPQILLLLLFLAILPLSAIAARGQGWKQIEDVDDPRIKSMGEFAVADFNRKTHAGLIFKAVLTVTDDVVDSEKTGYLLHLAVEGDPPSCFDTVVLEFRWLDHWEVLYFDSKSC
ncbi:cysteine proteinase inhibitor 5-like [Eucalyptus grandis]|uniref:cysteine proteinase inhibitor 5-like n=1 Tax=Eucalyptus grandis TaxID=71139 RepID=UPI00192F119E|nr:cysteine proteinase inhibitor 5-like [Eucalyptus grandis]